MKLNEYQKRAKTTALYPQAGSRTLVALNYVSEGRRWCRPRVCGAVPHKKVLRDGTPVYSPRMRGCPQVAQANLDKLASRAEQGTVQGSGDER